MSLPNDSTALPERKQDASLAGTYAARPGAHDAPPAGVAATTSEDPSSAPFVDSTNSATTNGDQTWSNSVKNSLDSVADQTPSTQSITEQLPSAQAAADSIKAGASSLLAGISNLALGVNDATAQNAAAVHPESEKARDVDDLHIPGAFEDGTSDREDIAAVQHGVQSATQALPSTQAVKEMIPGVGHSGNATGSASGSITEQVQTGARSVQEQAQQGLNYVNESLPGQQSQTENERIHKDGTDYIKSQLQDNNVSSVGQTSTTNQLAGRVPLESRAIPEVVKDSQRQAGGAAPLDEPAFSTLEASGTTAELAGQQPLEPRGVPAVVTDSQRQAGVSPEAAASPQAVQDKKHLEQEIRQEVPQANITSAGTTSTTGQLAGQAPLEPRGVPQIVADSQKRADVSPEASANAEAVREKKQVEQELRNEVPQQTGKDNTPVNLGEAISGGLATAGAAVASAAASARQTTQETTGADPVAILPVSAQRAIDGDAAHSSIAPSSQSGAVPRVVQASQQQAGVSPEASANPEAVREKSQLEQELQQEVPKQDDTIPSNLSESVAGGMAAVGAATASAATYAREKTAETTGTDPVSVLPVSAQQAIDDTAASDNSTHVPRVVSESQRAAGAGPEAAANPTAVQEKSEVERELRREVAPETATSGDQGITGVIAGGAATAGGAAAGAATYARQKTAEVTGTDPVSVSPESAQRNIDGTSTTGTGQSSHAVRELGVSTSGVAPYSDSHANSSFPRVVGEPVSAHGSSLSGVDLRSGVHNGVVGDHLDDSQTTSARRTPSREAGSENSAPVAHIGSLRNIDLSAGVKNTVVGSGAEHHSDQEALDRSSGL